MNSAFDRYRDEEVAWWDAHNVLRSREYFVRPSGHIDAPLACHLFNPTFTVDDPCIEETDDPSNPSISQLHDAGLSSANCLMFDHSARRDDSRDCRVLYPKDLWAIHEAFVSALRCNMTAVVEICWGVNVRERMLKLLHDNLHILPLWGRYEGITLYVELEEGRASARRFIIFASHPQFFMFLKGNNVRARAFRKEQGGRQDLLLEVASRLSKVAIISGFYEFDPLLLRPFRPPKWLRDQRDIWKGQALAELKKAFPGTASFFSAKKTPRLPQDNPDDNLQMLQLPMVTSAPKQLDLDNHEGQGIHEELVWSLPLMLKHLTDHILTRV